MKKELLKTLGLLDVFCIATGAMISSGIFILPGVAFEKMGPAMILGYLLASPPVSALWRQSNWRRPCRSRAEFTIIRNEVSARLPEPSPDC